MPSESTQQHRKEANDSVSVSILTVSDTRTLETDLGGKLIQDLCLERGFSIVERAIVTDDKEPIRTKVKAMLDVDRCDAVLITGGTGLAARDCTVDAVESLYDGTIPGYGELFRMLSYHDIGPASMLSRASGGRVGQKIVLTMPGSTAGVRLAMEKLILPELPHLVFHAGK
jgi:molybdenum cofactor biosynthesis protein B